MNNKFLAAIVVLFSIAIFANYARAQSTAFTYQGSLKNGGVAANGNYDFEFVLFDALSGGTQLGSPIAQNSVAVSNGIFSVTLDFGGQFPGANRFLEIHVRQTGGGTFTVLTPRQPITSAPYSVKSLSADTAANANQLGGVAANQFILTGDTRLSDSRQPTAGSANYIQNTTSPQGSSNFNISGNGVIGGNVGIGTAAPGSALEVRRNSTVASNWQTGQLRISGSSDPNKQLNLGYDTSSNAGVIQAGQAFTGFRPLQLNPFGGTVTVADGLSVGGDVAVTGRVVLQDPTGSPGATSLCVTPIGPPYAIVLCSSSYRYKTNISKFSDGLRVVRQLKPIAYNWKLGAKSDVGFGAEDVEKIDKRLVVYNEKGQVEGVKYDRIGVVLVNAVKEQQAQIEQLQKTIADLKTELESLKNLVCRTRSRSRICRK